jgi:hypothetical protein
MCSNKPFQASRIQHRTIVELWSYEASLFDHSRTFDTPCVARLHRDVCSSMLSCWHCASPGRVLRTPCASGKLGTGMERASESCQRHLKSFHWFDGPSVLLICEIFFAMPQPQSRIWVRLFHTIFLLRYTRTCLQQAWEWPASMRLRP